MRRYLSGRSVTSWLLLVIIGSMVADSCSPRVAEVTLPYDTLRNFYNSGKVVAPDRWWTAFNDPQLDALIDTALRDNLSLRAVWHQLEEASALSKISSSSLFPNVDLSLQSGISRPKPDFVGGENTQLSLRASYEVDLWGRIRYNAHADQYRMEATRYDYKAAAISLAGEIALTWFRLNAALQQLKLVTGQVATNEKVLALIRVRFGTGQVRGVDLLRQKQLIGSTKEQKIVLESQIGVLKNQLAVLLGQPPGINLTDTLGTLPDLPPLPDTGLPLQLVNRRPDVLSTFYQLQAADREVAAAVSAKYPRLSLSLTAAIRSNDINDLLQSQAVSLSGGLLTPLFYGGRLNAQLDQAEAVRSQQINTYSQAVLTAFQEVENALIRERKQQERIVVVEDQVRLAGLTNQQLEIEYLNGTSEYLDILTALNQEQQLQRSLIAANLALLEIRVSLYRAIAGGFETERENMEEGS